MRNIKLVTGLKPWSSSSEDIASDIFATTAPVEVHEVHQDVSLEIVNSSDSTSLMAQTNESIQPKVYRYDSYISYILDVY